MFRKVGLWWLQFRGKKPADIHEERITSGKAWEEFCDTLKSAGAALVFPGAPKDAFNQAEGYRYLSRLTRAGLEAFIEYADPAFPELKRMVHETVKMGADNPDNYYQSAKISGEYEYRITGNRGSVHYLGIGTQKGHYGKTGGLAPTGFIEGSELTIDLDGSFEIILSCQKQAGNWLPMVPETTMIIVRQTFLDRANEKLADLHIECLNENKGPAPVTSKSINEGLDSASTLVAGASLLFAKWARDFQKHTNQLPQFDPAVSNAAGGDANIAYYHSYWRLAPDEILVIDALPPECEHWNFQLNNHWMESLDYRYHTIHINKHSAQYNPDGSVRIIVAHTNPDLPNWIDTVGHNQGTMCFRWVRAKEQPQPKTQVVKFNELKTLSV